MSIFDSVVVTGAGGMLGHAVVEALQARGITPLALTRAQCDISTDAGIDAIFAAKPTLIFNCAAHTKVDLCEQETDKADAINGHGVGKIAERCAKSGTKLVHVSTDFVFNGQGTAPYKIDHPVEPLSAYGRSKLLGETEIQKHNPPGWIIARTAWVYGRHGANFPRTMVTVAKAGKPLSVVCDQVGTPTYTGDLAAALLSLVDDNHSGMFHLTNQGQTDWASFARKTLETFGIDHPVGPITSADWQKVKPNAAWRPRYSVLDLSKYEKTGAKMRPWEEALSAYFNEVEKLGF